MIQPLLFAAVISAAKAAKVSRNPPARPPKPSVADAGASPLFASASYG